MEKYAVGLCRVSTTKAAQQGESLETQDSICRRVAEAKGATMLNVWHEPFSGRTERRAIIQEILNFVKRSSNPVHYFIFRGIDRLTRAGSAEYQWIKNEFRRYGTELVDSYGMIQPTMNTLDHLGVEFSWSRYSPSDMAETLQADLAKDEVRTILTRLIGSEIQIVREGYQIGPALDGFVNQRITVGTKRKFVQARDAERAPFFEAIYELRASNRYSDKEIVEKVNAMGYRSKRCRRWNKLGTEVVGEGGGKPLTVKRLQAIVRRAGYCGVICEKWTGYKPIRAKWSGLVSIESFNRANRGAVHIQENADGKLGILYNWKPERLVMRRLQNNPAFPYKYIRCDLCGKPHFGSFPRGKLGGRFPTYHCMRRHRYVGIPKATFEATVEKFISERRLAGEYRSALTRWLTFTYEQRKREVTDQVERIRANVASLKSEQSQLTRAFVSTQSEVVKRELERTAERLEAEIQAAEREPTVTDDVSTDAFVRFLALVEKTMEHPEEMLIDKQNPLRQSALFGLIFNEMPTYSAIANGTPNLNVIFAKSQQLATGESEYVHGRGLGWNTFAETIKAWLDAFAGYTAPAPSNSTSLSPPSAAAA